MQAITQGDNLTFGKNVTSRVMGVHCVGVKKFGTIWPIMHNTSQDRAQLEVIKLYAKLCFVFLVVKPQI